ncbi:MAG: NAD(P)H-hydrate epimerase [Planctomycetota bacterium]
MPARAVRDNDPRLTREQSRLIDRLAIEQLKIPGVVLTENAGINAADVAMGMLDAAGGKGVAVVCGGGNNGGDGYVISRHLHNAGVQVSVYSTVPIETLLGDAAVNCTIAGAMGLPIRVISDSTKLSAAATQWITADLLIDAVLGTGFQAARGLQGEALAVIEAMQGTQASATPPMILAVDAPSGLDAETGEVNPVAVRADATVTFVAPKVGFFANQAGQYLGQVFVADIGTPPELTARVIGAES